MAEDTKGKKADKRKAGPDDDGAADNGESVAKKAHDLERQNQELRVRLKELELALAERGLEEGHGGEMADEDDYLAVVKDLEGEIDATLTLKEALEADLAAAQEKASHEAAARAEIESRLKVLESQAGLADQLRQEVSFVEEERNKATSVLAEKNAQLDALTQERDTLSDKAGTLDSHFKKLQSEKTDLEAQVLNLRDKVVDLDRLRQEAETLREERDTLEKKVQDLTRSLTASNNLVNALKLDLDTTRELVRDLRSQVQDSGTQMTELREDLSAANTDLSHTRAELDAQVEANKRLEEQVRTLAEKHKSVSAELETAKKALRNLHSAAIRVRERTRLMRSSSGG
jgi:chromosome segregation ATPase